MYFAGGGIVRRAAELKDRLHVVNVDFRQMSPPKATLIC
jgi:hypothetical protein